MTVVALLFHTMAGYALARLRFPGRETIFILIFSTFLVSLPVIIVPLFILVRAMGMLNSYAGLIVPSIFNAFGIFLLRQFYLSLPRELEEAAVIDGAGYWRIYWSVILPLSRPIIACAGDPVLSRQLELVPLAADRHPRRQSLGRAGRHRQLPQPVRGVVELHHGGLDDRRRAHAHPVRDLPEADHGIDQDQRPQIAADNSGEQT